MFNFFKKKQKPIEEKDPRLGYPTGPVLGQKGFVNEYVCDADIEKYKLQEIKPMHQRDLDKGYSHYLWAIDREREIWFMRIKSEKTQLEGYNRSDPEYYTGNDIYILHYKGENIEVIFHRFDEEVESTGVYIKEVHQIVLEDPYFIIKKPVTFTNISNDEIIKVLQDVLPVYKENIIGYVRDNIIVESNV